MKYNEFEENNILFLQKLTIPYATVRLTKNILKHSIFDANSEIRSFLYHQDLHDFEKQKYGQEYKIGNYILLYSNFKKSRLFGTFVFSTVIY